MSSTQALSVGSILCVSLPCFLQSQGGDFVFSVYIFSVLVTASNRSLRRLKRWDDWRR